MEQYYTVTGAQRLDGTDNYQNVTDSVFFKEYEGGSVLWKHAQATKVEQGTKVYGVIETLQSKNGKTYNKFTKKQVPDNTSQNSPSSSSQGASSVSEGSNGAKAGMAINNAAAYVTASREGRMEPEEFAAEVKRYAAAIYKIDPSFSDTPKDVLDFLNE